METVENGKLKKQSWLEIVFSIENNYLLQNYFENKEIEGQFQLLNELSISSNLTEVERKLCSIISYLQSV